MQIRAVQTSSSSAPRKINTQSAISQAQRGIKSGIFRHHQLTSLADNQGISHVQRSPLQGNRSGKTIPQISRKRQRAGSYHPDATGQIISERSRKRQVPTVQHQSVCRIKLAATVVCYLTVDPVGRYISFNICCQHAVSI